MLPSNFEWLPITRAEFDHALEIVPPVRFSSTCLFLRGEAQDVDEAGRSRFVAYRSPRGEGYFVGSRPITIEEFEEL